MSYTVLARRYRSREFDEVVGQEPIARTLRNAIASERTAHAYLFCGTRGVGKTSMARIFAKAMNVTDTLTEKDAIADAILRGEDLDVIEIDGASNRGINEARDIIANAGLHPTRCQYKIYIIDEVHMLTTPAFNALLKTMEEPPSHVKFILCTTDPHKVPATIQSRCQRFDFRVISTERIAAHLKEVLAKEEIAADDEVIFQVARLGNGSMRDALSVLDRLLAAGEAQLTDQLLRDMLGLPDQALIYDLVEAITSGDPKTALTSGGELLARGTTIEQTLNLLADHFRNMMVIAACSDDAQPLVELSAENYQRTAQQAADFDTAALVHMIAMCDRVAFSSRSSSTARALFDALLVRLCLAERMADVTALLEGTTAEVSRSGSGANTAPKKKSPSTNPNLRPNPRPSPSPGKPLTTSERVVEVKATTPPATPDTAGSQTETSGDGEAMWQRVVDSAGPLTRTRLEDLSFAEFDGTTFTLAVGDGGRAAQRWFETHTDELPELFHKALARRYRVKLIRAVQADAGGLDAADDPNAGSALTAEEEHAARNDPLVKDAVDIFDARVVRVQRSDKKS